MKKSFILTGILLCTTALFSFSQTVPEKGKFICLTEGGVLIGNSENANKAPFIFHSSLNYALSKNLSAGIGAGAEFLKETYLPVTANVLYQFRKDKSVFPFVRLQAGYQIALESNTVMDNNYYYVDRTLSSSSYYYYPYYQQGEKLNAQGGWMVNPSIGVIIYTRAGLGFSLAAGYRYQKLNYSGKDDYIFKAEYNRLSLTLGITF